MSKVNSSPRFCKKCKVETERNAGGRCKPCACESSAAWRKANPERQKAYEAAWCAANPERKKAIAAIWMAANEERCKAAKAAWNKANAESIKENGAAWRKANPEQKKTTDAAWRVANPTYESEYRAANLEASRIRKQNREARKRANGGVLSKGLADKLFKLQRGLCPCCKRPLGKDYHLDHIDSISTGGPNTDFNIQLLRKICNLQKNAKHPIDFMQQRGFLL